MTSVDDSAFGGSQTSTYDGFDELVTSQDATGRQTQLFYDVLGRIDHTIDADGTTQWTYDGDGPNEIGQLVETLSPSGQHQRFGYEPSTVGRNRGLLATVTQNLVAPVGPSAATANLVTTYHYDDFSRLNQIDYPGISGDPFSVKYDFDGNGHTVQVSDAAQSSSVYWKLVSADEGYRIGTEQFGNGATTQWGYEPLTGRTSKIHTASGSQSIQDLAYGYDLNGNMSSRQQTHDAPTDHFGYDALNRLSSRINVTEAEEDYSYDPATGRMNHQDGVGDYTYFTQGRDWLKTAGENQYTHDALGNVQTRSGPSVPGGSQELNYTTFNLPSHIVTGTGASAFATDFGYDESGSRTVKQSGSSTTFYDGDLYQSVVDGTSTTHRYMIYAGGRAVAAATQTSGSGEPSARTLQYLHTDSLGSIADTTASNGSLLEHRTFTTFGRSGPTPGSSMPYGYTGQEHDTELGLINMHGRMYDPDVAQFMSPDPVMQAPVSQGFNRFTYGFNSPLNYVDPSGFDADPTTISIDAGLGVAYGVGLYFTVAGEAGATAAVDAAVPAATAAAGFAIADVGLADVATDGAAGVGFVVNTAILSGLHPAGVAAHTVQAASRATVVTGQGTPSIGRASSAVGTAPLQEGSSGITDGSNGPRKVPVNQGSNEAYCNGRVCGVFQKANPRTSIRIDVSHGRLTVKPAGGDSYSVHITSGRGQCINNPTQECLGIRRVGPIVPGHYTALSYEVSQPGVFESLLRRIRGDWGSFRVPLHPDVETARHIAELNRTGEFFIHGGDIAGSAGCADCGGGILGNSLTDRLVNDLKEAPSGVINVEVIR